MQPDFSFLPEAWQGAAAGAFGLCVIVLAAWARVFGKKEGPPAPKVQEFYAAGALADMGPVKELVEQAGLLFQQQVRTNIALEAVAAALDKAASAYVSHIAIEQREREMEEARREGYEQAKRDLAGK